MYTGFIGEVDSCGYSPLSNEPLLVLNVGNHLYELRCTERFLMQVKSQVGQTLKLYTHLSVKEDDLSLTAFASTEERDMFRILIGASGVGGKVALSILNTFDVATLVTFILNEDAKAITAVKGVGPKVAQRIVLDIKEKLKAFAERRPNIHRSSAQNHKTQDIGAGVALEETVAVLESLGYEASEIENSLAHLQSTHAPDTLSSWDAETLLRHVLKTL
ncbi:MAG: Holliday junction branch migration protein RuvA [Vampirovibrionales bacterium]